MSHRKNSPSSSIYVSRAIVMLVLLHFAGCATVQPPGYRLENCSMSCYGEPDGYTPEYRWPQISVPVPTWYARWKAQKDLPKPPQSPRFQPLPTRPMFSPSPSQQNRQLNCFGQLPAPEAWQTEAVEIPTQTVPSNP